MRAGLVSGYRGALQKNYLTDDFNDGYPFSGGNWTVGFRRCRRGRHGREGRCPQGAGAPRERKTAGRGKKKEGQGVRCGTMGDDGHHCSLTSSLGLLGATGQGELGKRPPRCLSLDIPLRTLPMATAGRSWELGVPLFLSLVHVSSRGSATGQLP